MFIYCCIEIDFLMSMFMNMSRWVEMTELKSILVVVKLALGIALHQISQLDCCQLSGRCGRIFLLGAVRYSDAYLSYIEFFWRC